MPRRRRVLAGAGLGLASALAGCTRGLRSNDVPGGVVLSNDRAEGVAVRLRALAADDRDGEVSTPEGDADGETVLADRTYPVGPDSRETVRDLFPGPGLFRVEARVDRATAADTLRLYRTLGGGLGVDTAFVTVTTDGVEVAATDRG
ncbi:hypothetical protein BRC97_06785 [Halobacteriales archaeon QS_6_71_20]|nr:MAG: hypothetical protein BRC97_06785 [Halobacteriales archaeon QS_6_71_20]